MSYLAFNSATAQSEHVTYRNSFACEGNILPSQKISMDQMVDALNEESILLLSDRPDFEMLNRLGFTPATHIPLLHKSDMIKRECIVASMKRNPGNTGYVCNYADDPNPIGVNPGKQSVLKYYGKASGPTAQCVDDNMTDYVHFAVNSAIQCLSGVGKIDSRTVYRKINNESAFNISVASAGGIGISQLTTPAVEEMINPKLGRGRFVIENVAKSDDPACTGFKDVAIQDLKSTPSMAKSNRCAWLSPGDGLARNLMYSIGYYLTMRDKYIIPSLKRYAPKLVKNDELISDLTSIAYGAEGIRHVYMLLQKFQVDNKTNVTELKSKIRENSKYLGHIKDKMREVKCIRNGLNEESKECKNLKLSADDLEGDSCVSPI